MAANGLDAYAITVREERHKPTKLLGAFDGRRSLFDVIYAILMQAEPYHHDVAIHHKCVTFENIKKSGDSVTGIAYAGEYGFSNNLIDVGSGRTNYKKKQTDASMVPFFLNGTSLRAIAREYCYASVLGRAALKLS